MSNVDKLSILDMEKFYEMDGLGDMIDMYSDLGNDIEALESKIFDLYERREVLRTWLDEKMESNAKILVEERAKRKAKKARKVRKVRKSEVVFDDPILGEYTHICEGVSDTDILEGMKELYEDFGMRVEDMINRGDRDEL